MAARRTTGRLLVLGNGVFLLGLCTAILASHQQGEAELRATIRVTAYTSVLWYLVAFTASAIMRHWPSPASRWLLTHRRYVGLSFATSHLAHSLAIYSLIRSFPTAGESIAWTTAIGGGLGLVLVGLMALTSNDAAVRILGGAAWNRLHVVGQYYLWVIFVFTYSGQARTSIFHGTLTALLVAALILRFLPKRTGTPIPQPA